MLFVWILATLATMWLATAIYMMATAVVAQRFGVVIERVVIGFAPFGTCICWQGSEWQWQIGWLPLYGSAQFFVSDTYDAAYHEYINGHRAGVPRIADFTDIKHELDKSPVGRSEAPVPPAGSFQAATPAAKTCLALAGPISQIALGLFLLLLPIILSTGQLKLSDTANTDVVLCAMGGLIVSDEPTNLLGQLELTSDIATEAFQKYVLFQPLNGWGGLIGSILTCAASGAYSIHSWFTCVGILLIVFAGANLLPLPTLNGGKAVIALAEIPFGSASYASGAVTAIMYFSLFATLIIAGRILWADANWVWHLAF